MPEPTPPSKTRWRLTQGECEIIAMALVEFAASVPPEWALGYPHTMYEIAAKLDITERLKAYAHQCQANDLARLLREQKCRPK